ncbi:MAG: ketoacyl-ACP synthase III [Desulfosarcina sp.]|jgi:3-oxoacyl-[acyl-carrier-protein] synthase-3
MTHAAITGWGKCMPPAVLTNRDLATFLDTNDEWITTRTGISERRVTHTLPSEMAYVAGAHAMACADLPADKLELIIYGSCTNDEQVPNSASGVQFRLGAVNAASMDVNTACTSFSYALSTATAMIRTGVVSNALVIGVEAISPYMDWENRDVSVLFGDGAAAVVLQVSEAEEGLIGEALGCIADARHALRVRGIGGAYINAGILLGYTYWDFKGKEIFKHAVKGMVAASETVMAKCEISAADIDLVVPHQANLRIIMALSERIGVPKEKVMLTVQRYGNMSAATVPVALVEALEEGRVAPGALVLMPAFGGGLTLSSHLVRWGQRVSPLGTTDVNLPPCTSTGLELVNAIRKGKAHAARSAAGCRAIVFPDSP